MSVASHHKHSLNQRISNDSNFVTAFLNEAITLFLNGEPNVARLLLRDLIKATIGFDELAVEIQRSSKSLYRMLSARGNPTMDNLTKIICVLRDRLALEVEVHSSRKI